MTDNKQTNLTYRDSGVDIDAGNYSANSILSENYSFINYNTLSGIFLILYNFFANFKRH